MEVESSCQHSIKFCCHVVVYFNCGRVMKDKSCSRHENLLNFENNLFYVEYSLRSLFSSKRHFSDFSTEIALPCEQISVKSVNCVSHLYSIFNFTKKKDNLQVQAVTFLLLDMTQQMNLNFPPLKICIKERRSS